MNTKNELDQRVGERLRSRRLKMGVSQSELGAAAGVSFQQVQKYERGANRISAGRMIQFAERLGVAPAYFVEGFGGGSKANGHTIKTARAIEFDRRQQRGCGGVAGNGADEASAPQIHGDAGTNTTRHGVSDQSGHAPPNQRARTTVARPHPVASCIAV